MLKRKMFDYLVSWKKAHGQECLLINGARQVGKSYIVAQFGRAEYDTYIEIDFLKHPEYAAIFEGSLSADEVFSRITLYMPGAHIVPGKTLLFLDEIQECPAARSAFKYLAQDGRCDVVGSGSLLGLRFRQLGDAPSLPVGFERQVTMRPLDFQEFMWALGYNDDAIDILAGHLAQHEAVPAGVNDAMMRLLREYLAVGGMPAVVDAFAQGKDYSSAHDAQLGLHLLYLDDIARYATPSERVKARACYESLPRQLAKENTKFQYAVVEKHGSARKFDGSVDWLVGSEMVLRCAAVSSATFPLASYEDGSRFRLYANDTGLLMAMFDFSMKAAVVDNTLEGPAKGGLYENLVACMLAANGVPLRYWMSKSGNREIEFLTERDASVVPIDVKASRGATVSLDEMLEKSEVKCGYKLISGNAGQGGKKITLPLYLAMFLGRT